MTPEPSLSELCSRCQHQFGAHSEYMSGPCMDCHEPFVCSNFVQAARPEQLSLEEELK